MLLIPQIRFTINFEISIHELSKKGILEIHEEFFYILSGNQK